MRLIDHTGQVFGRLTVVSRGEDYISPSGDPAVRWNCLCECGNDTLVLGRLLRRGETESCGCLRAEVNEARKVKVPNYFRAHKRVAQIRGAARQHPCVGCGAKAVEWSYNKDAPDELFDWVKARNGRVCRVRYSPNIEFYSPRCKACHAVFDASTSQ